jgi:uroporphyrinogen-III synthase
LRRLLILRPEPGATATVEKARSLGLEASAVPLFAVEPVEWQAPAPDGFDGLLLTSANAVRHGGEKLETLCGLPVYAVGEATAEAAGEAGFEITATGDAGVERLLASIDRGLRLLHLCGAYRAEPTNAAQEITPIIVYRSKAIDVPDLPTGETVALIHSPRAGGRFAELAANRDTISIVAISHAAADAVGRGWKSVDVAQQPTDDALLALAASLCNKPHPE